MSLLPWGKAGDAIARFESAPNLDSARAARAALDQLSKMEFIPGVKPRLQEFGGRFDAARTALFDRLIRRGTLEEASELAAALPSAGHHDDERVKLAYRSMHEGKQGPSLAGVKVAALKPDLRAFYFEAWYHELSAGEDIPKAKEALSAWIQHQRQSEKPHLELLRRHLADSEFDQAVGHLQSVDAQVQTAVAEKLEADASLPIHHRAHFFIQAGHSDRAERLLDAILAEQPADEWALAHRAHLADSSGNSSSARYFYTLLLNHDPTQSQVARRLGELAIAENDMEEARRTFALAWQAGDAGAGLAYAELLAAADPGQALEAARRLSETLTDAADLMRLAEIFLRCRSAADAAPAFRRALRLDQDLAEPVIRTAHAYVEKNTENRYPLLNLLYDVARIMGYPADHYRLLEAQDLEAAGSLGEARDRLEQLLEGEARWDALMRLGAIARSEDDASRLRMAKRLESALPDAEKAGRGTWAEVCYSAAILWEEGGRANKAVALYERLLEKEYQFRDAADRLERLRAEREADAHEVDRTVSMQRPAGALESRYELLEVLGEGGMGVVHKARDRKLDRLVALKFLSTADSEALEMLIREARTTAKLSHPNIVSIYDVAKEGGKWLLAMEFIDGPTLKELLKRGPLSPPDSLAVLAALLSALENAHENGIVHRDVKPANILIRAGAVRAENVKLMDFGLAKVTTESSILRKGMVAGTAAYMSPEQVRGEKVDHRTDLYACGCIFYECLTGKPLFKAEGLAETMFMHLNEEPARLLDNQVLSESALTQLILGFLARDPAMRYAGAGEASRAVEEYRRGRPR
ncbi:MAG: hypothetical protein A3G34_15365 [Candidatus Lindowbacteria bacterium RIFCSPLOWO2_12_FULL_62_27]|nr:MAG: hypothetical protein A3G34_15365 [Candidatus Lindowbacteria bacterium RIFCSPLOWO2_12_FULL_62_27]OGH63909.1 MAG: hypothetical protein A3I06_05045 [Candidatus Lindowbacteria bacterium RIFCSPLOWO2_02_FULL_62_12]